MNKARKFASLFGVGLIGAIIGSLLVPFLFNRDYLNSNAGLGAFIAPKTVINRVEERVTISGHQALFTNVLNKGYGSIVAIESFSGGKLLRSGSGLILTQDGLIATLNSIVPASADFYQVFVEDKIDKGKVVSRDYKSNIALIELEEKNLIPIDFASEETKLGSDLIILGKHVDLSGVNNFSLPSFVFEKSQVGDRLLAEYDQATYGGIVFDDSEKVVGILDWSANKPNLISASLIQKSFNNYVSSQK